MAWLEIIEIRASGSNLDLLELQLQGLIKEINQDTKTQKVKLYRHIELETDFSIHFLHYTEKAYSKCRSISAQLIQSLKEFGIVNYTVWVEQKDDMKLGNKHERRT